MNQEEKKIVGGLSHQDNSAGSASVLPTPQEEKRSKYWNRMVDIIDKNFPKGKSKERGRALVMLAEIEMMLNKEQSNPSTSDSDWKKIFREKFGRFYHYESLDGTITQFDFEPPKGIVLASDNVEFFIQSQITLAEERGYENGRFVAREGFHAELPTLLDNARADERARLRKVVEEMMERMKNHKEMREMEGITFTTGFEEALDSAKAALLKELE